MTAEKDAPLLCRLRLHRWGITTYPIGVRWCGRCGKRDHDPSGYDPTVIALLTRDFPPGRGRDAAARDEWRD